MGKLIIDGNDVYEIDEACMKEKKAKEKKEKQQMENEWKRDGTSRKKQQLFKKNLI